MPGTLPNFGPGTLPNFGPVKLTHGTIDPLNLTIMVVLAGLEDLTCVGATGFGRKNTKPPRPSVARSGRLIAVRLPERRQSVM